MQPTETVTKQGSWGLTAPTFLTVLLLLQQENKIK